MGLERYDELKGLDWSCLSMDGAMTKAPLGGGKTGANRRDMKLVRPILYSVVIAHPEPTLEQSQGMCLDKGLRLRRGAAHLG